VGKRKQRFVRPTFEWGFGQLGQDRILGSVFASARILLRLFVLFDLFQKFLLESPVGQMFASRV
jgi:hypothetical protein